MKKLLSITLALCLSYGIQAQSAKTAMENSPSVNAPSDAIQHERFADKLNLDENQKKQIQSIRNEARQEMKSRGMDNREFRQNLRAKTEKEIQAVLRPDQLVAFQEMKSERQERAQENTIKGKSCHGDKNEAKAKGCSGGQGQGKSCCKKDGGQTAGQGKSCCKKDAGQASGCSHGASTNTPPPANR